MQSCCFAYSTFYDVLVAVGVVASFRTPFYKRVYMFSYGVDEFSSTIYGLYAIYGLYRYVPL